MNKELYHVLRKYTIVNIKKNKTRETKTDYPNIFVRGNSIRIRFTKSNKLTLKQSPTPINLLKANNIYQQLISMIKDKIIDVNQINTNLINESFNKGYILIDLVTQKKTAEDINERINTQNNQDTLDTKTFYECFIDKSNEYRNQETVIPYQEGQLKTPTILTYERYISYLKYFNEIKVDKLNIQDVEIFIRHHAAQGNTYKYVNEMLRPIREILEQHVEFGIIKKNILDNKGLKTFMRKNLRHSIKYAELLTIDEVRRIINAENCIIKFIVLFGLFTGVRVGEVQMMTWSNERINIKENRITIINQFTSNIETTPKSQYSIRDIPIIMQPQNTNYQDNFTETVLLDIICHFYNKSRLSNYMFYDPTTKERWRNSDAINYRMKQFLNELGIFKHITYHDLRHWFTAYSYEKIGLILTSKYLGHSTTKETLDNYMKIKPDKQINFKEAQKYLIFNKNAPKLPQNK